MSIFGCFTSGELHFCKPAAVTNTLCSYCNNHNFLCPSVQRHQEKEKVDRNKAENEDETVLHEGFFLEWNSIAPFVAKTCVTRTVQLKTLSQGGHHGGMTDQGDLHQSFSTEWLPALWCLHDYKSVGGWASWYSGSIAVAIKIRIAVKKALLVKAVKAITYQQPHG